MNEWKLLLSLAAVFGFLSVQAVGGGAAVLPEMQREVHDVFGLTSDQFVQAYGLGQLVPGPNMLLVVVLGYRIAGALGALIALLAFFLPIAIIVLWTGRFLRRHLRGSPWGPAIRDGMAPVTIGLMSAGVYAMALSATTAWFSLLLALAVVLFMLRTKINPVWLVLGCAIVGAVAFPRQ
ncbi:MAG: chromate transporter [Vulcanimicrobiaceae bacterium]